MLSDAVRTMLVDLIEIKLSTLDITDREDQREMLTLKRALHEVRGGGQAVAEAGASVPPAFMLGSPKRGRRARRYAGI